MFFKKRMFLYWSNQDGVIGTISGRTAIGALKKEFGLEDIVWSHGSVTYDTSTYVVTDIKNNFQFDVRIKEVDAKLMGDKNEKA
jgi:hypothetical protein